MGEERRGGEEGTQVFPRDRCKGRREGGWVGRKEGRGKVKSGYDDCDTRRTETITKGVTKFRQHRERERDKKE